MSDAILNREWLTAWRYYWPNRYMDDEIIETWRSVALILSDADLIIPGHGEEILVTPQLIREMIAEFPKAEIAEECPDVLTALEKRLAALGGKGP